MWMMDYFKLVNRFELRMSLIREKKISCRWSVIFVAVLLHTDRGCNFSLFCEKNNPFVYSIDCDEKMIED